MKRKIYISLVLLLVIWIGYRGYKMSTTRSHSLKNTVHCSYKDLDISVTYGRPYKNRRVIFGEAKDRSWLPKGKFWTDGFRALTGLPRTTGALVPEGKYWRLGANNATEISFSRNINFAGSLVKARRYRMYVVPDHDSWHIGLNNELSQFGYQEPDYSLDLVKVNVPVEMALSETEQFTILYDSDSAGVKNVFHMG